MLRSRANEEPFEESYNGFAPLRAKRVFLFASSWAEIKLLFFGAFTSLGEYRPNSQAKLEFAFGRYKEKFQAKKRVFAFSKPAKNAEIFLANGSPYG